MRYFDTKKLQFSILFFLSCFLIILYYLMFGNQFAQLTNRNPLLEVLNIGQNPETVEEQQILALLQKYHQKIEDQIVHGDLQIFDRHKLKEEISTLQQERAKKQVELETAQNANNQQAVKQLKKQIFKLKQDEIMLVKQQAKIKKKEVLQNIKKWEEIQKEIRLKKEAEDALKVKKQNQQQLKIRKQEKEQQKLRRLQKKKKIEQKLKQIEKNRAKREQIIRCAELQYSKLHPKFLEIEKRFKQLEEEAKFEEDIFKKNHKISTKVDYSAIKSHQKEYMAKVEERNKKLNEMRASSVDSRVNVDFTPFVYRDQAKIEEERQKFKRRIEFQQRLKQIPIEIDQEKRKMSEIRADKGKNKLKYHFLGQKALNQQQIYEEFKQFEINVNPRQIGKEYLRELPSITNNSRITKSQSLNTLSERANSQRVKYIDYLQEIKANRPQKSEISEQILQNKAPLGSNRSKIIEQLAKSERKYSIELKRKSEQIEKYNNLKSELKKVKQIDEIYAKSIKAKLARIEITQ